MTAPPLLTKSPEKEKKSLYVSFCIGASIRIGREIRCLPYAGFFLYTFVITHDKIGLLFNIKTSHYEITKTCNLCFQVKIF